MQYLRHFTCLPRLTFAFMYFFDYDAMVSFSPLFIDETVCLFLLSFFLWYLLNWEKFGERVHELFSRTFTLSPHQPEEPVLFVYSVFRPPHIKAAQRTTARQDRAHCRLQELIDVRASSCEILSSGWSQPPQLPFPSVITRTCTPSRLQQDALVREPTHTAPTSLCACKHHAPPPQK